MKMKISIPNIETSKDLEEKFFSIADHGFIFDILRSKLYSNPIAAVCREITCNARDTHRAVGKNNVPIVVHLPNSLEPYFKVKDFGEGISPDRVENVFIKYAASTKRDDDTQTGYMGIGSKSPLAITDSFSVITNYNGTQYNYAIFIDETKIGKLALLSEISTTEPNGTEILIPVQNSNFAAFTTATEQVCRHYDIRPNIIGGHITWQEPKKILEGKNWFLGATGSYDYNRFVKLIIDGIEYPLDMTALRGYADMKIFDCARGSLYLSFGIGELSLSANREQVYLDKSTQKKIGDRINQVCAEVKQLVIDKIATFTNLWDVNVYYRKELTNSFSSLSFLGKLTWQGIDLSQSGNTYVPCSVLIFRKGVNNYSRRTVDPNKISCIPSSHLNYEEKSALYVNDLPLKKPTPKHVKKAFDDDLTLVSVQVICPTDKITIEELNKAISLDQMQPKLLSSITKASARTYTHASSRVLLFKFDPSGQVFKQVSYSSAEEDTDTKVLCKLLKSSYPANSRYAILANGNQFYATTIKSILNHMPEVSFYGVDKDTDAKRLKDDFADFMDIDALLKDELFGNSDIDFVAVKALTQSKNYSPSRKWNSHFQTLMPLIKDRNSVFAKILQAEKHIAELSKSTTILSLYEDYNGEISKNDIAKCLKSHPDLDIDALNKKAEQKYPLMNYVDSYYHNDDMIKHIADYINLIDER